MKNVKLQILIDARSMRKGQNGPTRYAENLLKNLAFIDHYNNYTIIVNPDYKDFINQDNFLMFSTSIKPYRIKEHWAISKLINNQKFDVFHSLQYIPPFGICSPLIMTIYDTMHMEKEFWSGSPYRYLTGIYARSFARRSMRKADSIITISSYSAMQINKTFQYPLDKIFPIHLGVDESYFNRDQLKDFSFSVDRWNIPGAYILNIGNMRPYKNVNILLRAFADLIKCGYSNYYLVLAGKATDEDMQSKKELADALSIGNRVFILNGLIDEDLKKLLGGSSVFVFPSKEEGFGLPLLEAMASGVPCIASDIEVFKEVCDETSLLFNPDDPKELKEKVINLIESSELRTELSTKGRHRAKHFTWRKSAEKTLMVYNHYCPIIS